MPAAPPIPNIPPGGCCPQPSPQICQLGVGMSPLSCQRKHGSTSEDNVNDDFCFPLNIFSNKYRRQQDHHKQQQQKKCSQGGALRKQHQIYYFFKKKLNIIYKSIFHKIMPGGAIFSALYIYYHLNISYRGQGFTPDNPPEQETI